MLQNIDEEFIYKFRNRKFYKKLQLNKTNRKRFIKEDIFYFNKMYWTI